jgi:hypothetical protein
MGCPSIIKKNYSWIIAVALLVGLIGGNIFLAASCISDQTEREKFSKCVHAFCLSSCKRNLKHVVVGASGALAHSMDVGVVQCKCYTSTYSKEFNMSIKKAGCRIK